MKMSKKLIKRGPHTTTSGGPEDGVASPQNEEYGYTTYVPPKGEVFSALKEGKTTAHLTTKLGKLKGGGGMLKERFNGFP